MSFRTRLISFFVLIVVLPMLAVGFLVFRLIGQSEQGKADARVNGLATAAASIYESESAAARADAASLGRRLGSLAPAALRAEVPALAARAGLVRVRVTERGRVLLDTGGQDAVAPGSASVAPRGAGTPLMVSVSESTAAEYVRRLQAPGVGIVVRSGARTLSFTGPAVAATTLPDKGTVTVAGTGYRVVTVSLAGFDAPARVSVLSSISATGSSGTSDRLLAAIFIIGGVLLALGFTVLASQQLHGQISRFLHAAKRLGDGDFSAAVPIEGRDEFAALGHEFNRMSAQLARRLDELTEERARLRGSIRRTGEILAANLDRQALLELALSAAVDAVEADRGRLSARTASEDQLGESARIGSLDGLEEQILAAERAALEPSGLGEARSGEVSVLSLGLGPLEHGGRAQALITLAREGQPFDDDDRDILRSLASQATAALENVELHVQVSRQAVTDELTGLANHGRFQELLGREIEQVRRYGHPLGLIMLDLDNFKTVNDTYGHQQGDVVLKLVGRVLRENSREADVPARYGGEEMALILPHTDLEGAYAIAERVRLAIDALRIPRLDGHGQLRVTASLGVAASAEGEKDELVGEADAALYGAKRQGKNRTLRALAETANVSGGE